MFCLLGGAIDQSMIAIGAERIDCNAAANAAAIAAALAVSKSAVVRSSLFGTFRR